MSNRTEDQISAQAELRLSHLAQIEALTKPGLSDRKRVEMFSEAAGLSNLERSISFDLLVYRDSPARTVWSWGEPQRSLFANLPGCRCPVIERLDGIPLRIPNNWRPTAAQLETFSRIQIKRRFG